MAYKLEWDKQGTRFYENGVSNGVLFVYDTKQSKYGKGVSWSGLTSISESPDGGDATDMYADNIKYASMRSAEKLGGTIEAYTYPDEFAACDGVEGLNGVMLRQQARAVFALAYRTEIGNDESSEYGYKIHILYGATCSPSDRQWQTINDSPDAVTLSWEFETTPIPVEGHRAISILEIDSRTADPEKMASFLKKLYGDTETQQEPELMMPADIIAHFAA